MSQGQAYMPIHSSPAQNQTTQSPWKNLKSIRTIGSYDKTQNLRTNLVFGRVI